MLFQVNGIRLELSKTEDIEHLGRLIFGKVDKLEKMNRFRVDAYRYLLIIMKSTLGFDSIHSDK